MVIPSVVVLFFVYRSIDLKALVVTILAAFFIGGIFDIWATRQGRKDKFWIWEYNPRTTLNKHFMGMTIEDVTIFLILTPIFTIVVWEAAKKLISIYNISLGLLVVGGAVFVLIAYFLTYNLTKPKTKRK